MKTLTAVTLGAVAVGGSTLAASRVPAAPDSPHSRWRRRVLPPRSPSPTSTSFPWVQDEF